MRLLSEVTTQSFFVDGACLKSLSKFISTEGGDIDLHIQGT